MAIKFNDEINQNEWKIFIDNHPLGNIFQHPLMYNFYKSQKGYEVLAIDYEENGNIIGIILAVLYKDIIPRHYSRIIISGGPIVKNDSTIILDSLLKCLISKTKNKSIYIEIRNFYDICKFKDTFFMNNFSFQEHYNILVPLEGEEELLKKINKGKLRQIRKSITNNCEIIESNNLAEVYSFYNILKELYKNKVHKPLPEWSFFDKFRLDPTLGKFFLIKYREEIVGGIMCPIYKGKVIYEWYIASKENIENIFPGVLATWAPIQYGLNNNFSLFDFMGAGKPDEEYGVRQFKLQFGGNLVNYGRLLHINNRFLYFLGKLYINIIKNGSFKNQK